MHILLSLKRLIILKKLTKHATKMIFGCCSPCIHATCDCLMHYTPNNDPKAKMQYLKIPNLLYTTVYIYTILLSSSHHMGITCTPHRNHMYIRWKSHAQHMGTPCTPHRYHMFIFSKNAASTNDKCSTYCIFTAYPLVFLVWMQT